MILALGVFDYYGLMELFSFDCALSHFLLFLVVRFRDIIDFLHGYFMQSIVLRGARTHNLKNALDLTLPRDKLVVITGLSGSGKSSLAFDTLYAEVSVVMSNHFPYTDSFYR